MDLKKAYLPSNYSNLPPLLNFKKFAQICGNFAQYRYLFLIV